MEHWRVQIWEKVNWKDADLNSHLSEKQVPDTDPHQSDVDPQHCFSLVSTKPLVSPPGVHSFLYPASRFYFLSPSSLYLAICLASFHSSLYVAARIFTYLAVRLYI